MKSPIVISAISLVIALRIATLDDLSLGAKLITDGALLGALVVYLVIQIGYARRAEREAEKRD